MIQEYFNTPSENFIKFYEDLSDSTFGKKIHVYNIDVSDLDEISSYDLAIFYLGDVKEMLKILEKKYILFNLEIGV